MTSAATRNPKQGEGPAPRGILKHWASQAGERPAIVTPEGAVLDYAGLYALSLRAQEAAAAAGVHAGDRVALALPNSADYVNWIFAIVQVGATAVPMDPRLPGAEREGLLADARCSFRIAHREEPAGGWQNVAEHGACVIQRRTGPVPWQPGRGGLPLFVQFSSGSTSRPKHMLRQDAQMAACYSNLVTLGLDADTRYLGLCPFYHAYGAQGLWATLFAGGTVMPVSRFLPATVLDCACSFAPTLLLTTPQMINALGRCHLKPAQETAFAAVEVALCGGAVLAEEDYRRFKERFGVSLKIQYGSTETLSVSIVRDGVYAPGRVGQPYPGVEIAIFDQDGTQLAPLQTGKVGIRSAACCEGYGSDVVEPLANHDGFVMPGDVGFLDAQGELFLRGRDDVINIAGYKVAPAELETLIGSTFSVGYVRILPFDRGGVPALRAVIESQDPNISERAVMELCAKNLLAYKVPARVDIFAKIPRNEGGKVTMAQINHLLDHG